MCERKFTVIGISDSREQYFSPTVNKILKDGRVFSGGKRHYEIMSRYLPEGSEWIDITVPLEEVFAKYTAHVDIIVFASGDPLFYGFATTLMREFPMAEITVIPSFNSLQLLAHRLKLPYSEMTCVSLTGRKWKNLDIAIMEGRKMIGVLTDRKKGPSEIARRLLEYGYDNYEMVTGESLGNEELERVRRISLTTASQDFFVHPNCVILLMKESRKRYFGIPAEAFAHLQGRSNMITKTPVRLMALSMLDLYGKNSLWDIGFCTGSVSIEAMLAFPSLEVTSFERREESRVLLSQNCRKFGAMGITGVICDFMENDLRQYPRPDAVFIGGHGGRLNEMVRKVSDLLLPGGVIVFNSVSDESLDSFRFAVERCGRKIVAAHRLTLDRHNPITIMKAE